VGGSFFAKALIVVGVALVFVVRVELYDTAWSQHSLVPFVKDQTKGTKVTVEGVVAADPDSRDTTLHANIRVSKLNSAEVDGTLIAFFPTETELTYGQRVVVKGTLRVPDTFETDGGNEFDYPHYLQAQGISAMLTSAKLASSTPAPVSLSGTLFAIKHTFNNSLERIFMPPLAALIEGIILGERRGIPDDLNHAFIVASLVHIVVLSGHVFTIVADAVMRVLSFLPKKIRYPLAAVFIVLFILMVGATTIALRAGIMAGIGMIARFFNRQNMAMRALVIAVIGMALWNPPAVI
jgi:predicted membrane metal-binding protein